MLAVERAGKTEPMSSEHSAAEGDLVTVAIHTLEREEALGELAELGWLAVAEGPEADASAATAEAS